MSFDTQVENVFSLWKTEYIFDVIVDRKSRYHVVGIPIVQLEEVKQEMQRLRTDKNFIHATHNSYAYRIKNENGTLMEWKNDDGETGAGNCILREMQRANAQNMILVVTRFFWGIHLQADRFKNVIDACKIFFERQK